MDCGPISDLRGLTPRERRYQMRRKIALASPGTRQPTKPERSRSTATNKLGSFPNRAQAEPHYWASLVGTS